MGLYADLPAEDKAIIEAWERNARGGFNSMARMVNEFRALQAALDASGGPRDIITALDPGEEIPNTSGLAGAHSMTKQEWSDLVALLDGFLTSYDTAVNRRLYAKAAGPTAGL